MLDAFPDALDRDINGQPAVFQVTKTHLNGRPGSQFCRQRANAAPPHLRTGVRNRVLTLDNLYQDRFLILFLRMENPFGSHRQTRVAWNECRRAGPPRFAIRGCHTKAMRIDISDLKTRRVARVLRQQKSCGYGPFDPAGPVSDSFLGDRRTQQSFLVSPEICDTGIPSTPT